MATKIDLTEHVALATGIETQILERLADVDSMRSSDALALLVGAKEMAGQARDIVRIAETLLIDSLNGRSGIVDGHPVQIRQGYSRKWDQGLVVGAIAACVLQGERIPGVDAVVKAVAGALYGSTQWSVTALKDMGIDDSKYCERELGKPTVSVL